MRAFYLLLSLSQAQTTYLGAPVIGQLTQIDYSVQQQATRLKALVPIDRGSLILGIARDYTLDSQAHYEWSSHTNHLPPQIRCAIRLLYRVFQQKNEFFIRYFHTMSRPSNVLPAWSSAEKAFLKDLALQYPQEYDWDYLQYSWAQTKTVLLQIKDIDPQILDSETFQHAMAIVYSRQFTVSEFFLTVGGLYEERENPEIQDESVIVPFIDLVNHSGFEKGCRPRNSFLSVRNHEIYFFAAKDFEVGQEITADFLCEQGDNFNLLLYYGIILEVNAQEKLTVSRRMDSCNSRCGDGCCWGLQTGRINQGLLESYNSGDRVTDWARYRTDVMNLVPKWSIRELRRMLIVEQAYRRNLAVRYALAQRSLVAEHVELIEQSMIDSLLGDLNL